MNLIETYSTNPVSMRVIRVPLPEGFSGFDDEPLSESDIEKIAATGALEARYCYGYGGYEGAGHLLVHTGAAWYHHSLSHCSCYGPVEHLALKTGYPTLDALLQSCSEDLREELMPLMLAPEDPC